MDAIRLNISLIIDVAKKNLKKLRYYKAANVSGLIVNLFWMIVQASILYAFTSNGISNMTPRQSIGYMIITESLLMITGIDGGLGDIDIDDMIKSGSIIMYFIKPLGFIPYLIGLELGRIMYYLVWRAIPIFVIGCLIYQWFPAMDLTAFLLFIISVLMAVVIANTTKFIVSMLALRSKTTNGINDLFMAVALFFSGGLLPLSFFPEWLYRVSLYLPFSAQIYLPASILLGTEENVAFALIVEAAWCVLLTFVSYILYSKERRYLIVQGG